MHHTFICLEEVLILPFILFVYCIVLIFCLFQLMNAVIEMKQKNPELKLLLSVVSVSSSEDTFAAMVSSSNNRKK